MTGGFVPTEEQRMLRDSVRRWVEQFDPRQPDSVDAIWSHFAEMGWLAAGFPETLGGLSGGIAETAIIAEELGRGLVCAPYIEVTAIAALILLELAPNRVPAILTGSTRPVLAHHEQETRNDLSWAGCRASKAGQEWYLSGHKVAILGASSADSVLVTATVSNIGLTLFELPAAAAPMDKFATIDGRSYGDLHLHNTRATLVGKPGAADAPVRRALNHALVLSSAEAVGTMDRALELTTAYLLSRRQFGQTLAEFQVLRHRLADMFIQLEQARSLVMCSVAALAREAATSCALAAATKARVAQAAMYVGAQAIQLHGGIGLTDEYAIGHYFKRLLAFSHHQGTSDTHVERFSHFPQGALKQLLYPEVQASESQPASRPGDR